jgi:ubiquinone/menaquinone biosynthesis C-methylase UbiE
LQTSDNLQGEIPLWVIRRHFIADLINFYHSQSVKKGLFIMPSIDPYNITDKLDDGLLDVIATRLEARGKHPLFIGMLNDYLEAMNIDAAGRVLDMGCGTGVAARTIAQREGFGGHVVGVDLSASLTTAATRLADNEGVANQVEFEAGDTQSLGLNSESFDAVVAHTLLSHVDDPGAVLSEARRVVRPGGLIGVFDGDYGSLTFEVGDEQAAKEYDEKLIRAVITQPRVLRRMPIIAKELGLEIVDSFSYVLSEIGQADFWKSGIQSFGKLVPKSGVMSEAEAEAWAQALLEASDTGVFFGSCNYYGYVLKRI